MLIKPHEKPHFSLLFTHFFDTLYISKNKKGDVKTNHVTISYDH